MQDVEGAIKTFVGEWQRLYDEYMQKRFPTNPNPRLEYTVGRRFAKVIRSGAVEAFIDLNTGDIYKAATWNQPALHARGNVFSDQNGIEALETTTMHPHIRYLRG